VVRRVAAPSEPVFDGPAPVSTVAAGAVPPTAVLDPFSVAEKGEALLRQELSALSPWHLVNIIAAYELSDEPPAALNQLPASDLRRIIVEGVRVRTAASTGHVSNNTAGRRWSRWVAALAVALLLAASAQAAQRGRGQFGGGRGFGQRIGGAGAPLWDRYVTFDDFDGSFQFCRLEFRNSTNGDGD